MSCVDILLIWDTTEHTPTHTSTVNGSVIGPELTISFLKTNIRPETHKTRRARTIRVPLRLFYAFVSSVCVTGGQWRQQRCALVSKVAWNERVFSTSLSTSLTGKQLKRSNECRVDGSRLRTAPSGGGSGQRPSQGQVHTVMEAVLFVKGMEQKEAQTAFTGQRAAAAAATSSSQF